MNKPISFSDIIETYFENKDIPIYFYKMEERPKAIIPYSVFSKSEEGCFFIPGWFYKPITRFVKINEDE